MMLARKIGVVLTKTTYFSDGRTVTEDFRKKTQPPNPNARPEPKSELWLRQQRAATQSRSKRG